MNLLGAHAQARRCCAQNRPLLNAMVVSATGAMFHSAIDASSEYKGAEYIAEVTDQMP
jgi:hypothetical protein